MKKLSWNVVLSAVLLVSIILNYLTVNFPYIHEDEGIYVGFALSGNITPNSGHAWSCFIKIATYLFSPEYIRIAPLSVGVFTAFIILWIVRKVYKLNIVLASLICSFVLLNPVFMSQSHRIRPEILHCFFAISSVSFIIRAFLNENLKTKKEVILNSDIVLSFLFWLFTTQCQVMGVLHSSGIGLMYFFYFLNKSKNNISFSVIISILFFIIFCGVNLLTIFHNTPLAASNFDSFQYSSFWDLVRRSFGLFKINFEVWFWGVYPQTKYEFINYYYSSGRNIRFENVFLFFLNLALLIQFFSRNKFKFKLDIKNALYLSASVTCICFFLSIMIFARHNNSYNIVYVIWLAISLSYYLQDIKYVKASIIILVNLLVVSSLFHFFLHVYPNRHSNFPEITKKTKDLLFENNCNRVISVSNPYSIFIKNHDGTSFLYSDFLGQNVAYEQNERFKMNYSGIEKITSKDDCLVVAARQYYGLGWWANYPKTIKRIKKYIDMKYDLVAKFRYPFYSGNNYFYDAYYPSNATKDDKKFPVGNTDNHLGGAEEIFIFKPNQKALDRIVKL